MDRLQSMEADFWRRGYAWLAAAMFAFGILLFSPVQYWTALVWSPKLSHTLGQQAPSRVAIAPLIADVYAVSQAANLDRNGQVFLDRGAEPEAIDCLSESLKMKERMFGADDYRLLPTLSALMSAHFCFGDYLQAEILRIRSKRIADNTLAGLKGLYRAHRGLELMDRCQILMAVPANMTSYRKDDWHWQVIYYKSCAYHLLRKKHEAVSLLSSYLDHVAGGPSTPDGRIELTRVRYLLATWLLVVGRVDDSTALMKRVCSEAAHDIPKNHNYAITMLGKYLPKLEKKHPHEASELRREMTWQRF